MRDHSRPPLIVADKRLPEKALSRLEKEGELLLFETRQLVYEAISGHPDIFFCRLPDGLVLAPNLPENYKEIIRARGIPFTMGLGEVGAQYPDSAHYNVVVTERYLIGNGDHMDPVISTQASSLKRIEVRQAYTRCNLLPLNNDRFLTSDEGIWKNMKTAGLSVMYVDPSAILLPGFKNGFFGGCCGCYGDTVFMLGSLDFHKDGDQIKSFIHASECEIVSLYDGPLIDGGSLLFL